VDLLPVSVGWSHVVYSPHTHLQPILLPLPVLSMYSVLHWLLFVWWTHWLHIWICLVWVPQFVTQFHTPHTVPTCDFTHTFLILLHSHSSIHGDRQRASRRYAPRARRLDRFSRWLRDNGSTALRARGNAHAVKKRSRATTH